MPGSATLEIHQSVAVVTIENPGRLNAIDDAVAAGLADATARIKERSDVGALILRGAGREAFCSGADLKYVAQFEDRAEAFRHLGGALQRFFATVAALPFPSIAMLHGVCYGGGVQLAIATDFRFADTALRLAIPAVKNRLIYPIPALARLLQLIGSSHTRRLILEGRTIAPETLLAWGLVDELHAPDEIEAATLDFAGRLAAQPRDIVAAHMGVLRALDRGETTRAEQIRDQAHVQAES